MSQNTFREQALRETAQSLEPVQRQLLTNLSDRGPGLLLELAVRQLAFPEQIGGPLNDLRERGLVRGEPFSGGQLGGELYYLTADGQQVAALLQETAARGERLTAPDDLRVRQVDLLQKLGDLAARGEDFARATRYYRQALITVRQLVVNADSRGGTR